MPSLTTFLLVATGVAVWTFFAGDKGDDDKPVDNSASSPRPAGTTEPSVASPTSASSSRSQTTANTPATSRHIHDLCHRSQLPTHDSDPHRTPLASTPTQRSYQQPSTYVRPVQAEAKTQATLATPDDDLSAYYSSLASSRAEESRRTLPSSSRSYSAQQTSTHDRWTTYQEDGLFSPVRDENLGRTIVQESGFRAVWDDSLHCEPPSPSAGESPQAHLTSTRLPYLAQWASTRATTTVTTSPTADDYVGSHPVGLPSPDVEESHLAHLPPSPESPSYYWRSPSPDSPVADVFGSSESPQTRSRTLSSSSDSDYRGADPSPRAIPRFPRPVPDGPHDLESNKVANKQNMEMARMLREQARRSHREMQAARDRAKSARRRRDSKAERTYSGEVRSHESERKILNKRAAKIIFTENNKAHREGTVDLHGLYANEAVEYAKEEIQSAMYRNEEAVCFITGKGSHAGGGVSKLRPALEELCDERQLAYSLDPENAGRLIVYLD